MLIKAKTSFAGSRICMYEGEVVDCGNPDTVRDLQRAGYIEIVTPEEPVTPDEPVTQEEPVEHEDPEKPKEGRKKASKNEAVIADDVE